MSLRRESKLELETYLGKMWNCKSSIFWPSFRELRKPTLSCEKAASSSARMPSALKKHGRPITTCIKVLDMTGLKLSTLNQIKVQVLNLISVLIRYVSEVIPFANKLVQLFQKLHLVTSQESGSENCYSLDHPFHQHLYNYIKQQARLSEAVEPIKQGSFHIKLLNPSIPWLPDTVKLLFLGSSLYKVDFVCGNSMWSTTVVGLASGGFRGLVNFVKGNGAMYQSSAMKGIAFENYYSDIGEAMALARSCEKERALAGGIRAEEAGDDGNGAETGNASAKGA
ncbi:hypothetical protein E2542_SST04632 [Spatholobus suberectus]|nr:hypothetical protein E2542_SST04632 [Spatholobus suberectus]